MTCAVWHGLPRPSCQIDLVLDSPGNCDVQHLRRRMVVREQYKNQIPEPNVPMPLLRQPESRDFILFCQVSVAANNWDM